MHMRERIPILQIALLPSLFSPVPFVCLLARLLVRSFTCPLSLCLSLSKWVALYAPTAHPSKAWNSVSWAQFLWYRHPLPHPQVRTHTHICKYIHTYTHTYTSHTYASHFRIQQLKIATHLNCFAFIMQMSTFGYEYLFAYYKYINIIEIWLRLTSPDFPWRYFVITSYCA